ncbi:MAG TPA: hypothetical protein ENI34_08155 [candidate division WOR-3 bacterium]|uniref:Polysaccharide biosynthesis protein C-terminal domain-containing protein n=1 Tax=candidate division WOR-3 bacterium TaxID=2052148 RepID=A0A9C9ENB4_UNCW3|nr:hypothetical protein [candidate division WOR-3 bacterium]
MSEYFKKTFSVLSTQVLILPLTVLAGIIIARFLGPAGKGSLTLIVLIATTMKLLGGMGMEFANVYYASKERKSLPNIISNNIVVWLFSTTVLICIFILARPFLCTSILKNIHPQIINFAIIVFPFILGYGFVQTLFQGLEKFKEYNILRISEPVTKLTLVVLLIIVFKLNIKGGFIAILLSYVVPVILSIVLIKNYVKYPLSINKKHLVKSIKYGLKGQVGIFFQFFNYRLDMFLVSYYLDIREVGLYALSVVIAEFLWYIPNSISVTLFPKVSAKDTRSANEFTRKVSRTSITIMLMAGSVICLVAPFLIRIFYGERFIESVIPLRILIPGVIAFGMVKILTGHLHGRGKPQYGSIVTVCSLLLTILFDLLLIPRLGITGAALATTFAYLFSFVLTLVFFVNVTGLSLKEILIPDFGSVYLVLRRIFRMKK